MSLTKRQREIEAQNRAAAGLPVHRCPACGEIGRHWVTDSLDEHDVVVPGYFTCGPAPEPVGQTALDIEVTA